MTLNKSVERTENVGSLMGQAHRHCRSFSAFTHSIIALSTQPNQSFDIFRKDQFFLGIAYGERQNLIDLVLHPPKGDIRGEGVKKQT